MLPSVSNKVDYFSNMPSDVVGEICQHLPTQDQLSVMALSKSFFEKCLYKQTATLDEIECKEVLKNLGFELQRFSIYHLHEIQTTESERRWFELRIVGFPTVTKLESCKIRALKFFDRLPKALAITLHIYAILLFGIGWFAAIFSWEVGSLMGLGISSMCMLVGGTISYLFFQDRWYDSCLRDKSLSFWPKEITGDYNIAGVIVPRKIYDCSIMVMTPSKVSEMIGKRVYLFKSYKEGLLSARFSGLFKFFYVPVTNINYERLKKTLENHTIEQKKLLNLN